MGDPRLGVGAAAGADPASDDGAGRSRGPGVDRVALLVFLAAWLAYGSFHQGGGWHQNARFAAVRALVEGGRLAVDDHVLYAPALPGPDGAPRLRRVPVERGAFELAGRRRVLAWSGSGAPLEGDAGGDPVVPIDRVLATGDLAYARGHLHPAKAPGATWLAVPAYALLHRITTATGGDPDAWWVLTRNAWLTGVGSVGLLAALGAALFHREARRLVGGAERPALVATCAFAFGTPYFPYATMLFGGDVAAVSLLLAWAATSRAGGAGGAAGAVAGLGAGLATASSYSAALAVPLLGVAAARRGGPRAAAGFAAGLSLPLALLALHHAASLGTPFATAYQFMDPLFVDEGAWLGVLDAPSLERLVGITISPYRGLLLSAPVLVLAVPGLAWLAAERSRRGDAVLLAGLVAVFVLFNVCFNGWHGGWSVGPRYLVPALPFLCLPLAIAARRAPRATAALALASVAVTTLATAVDPQPPVGSSPIAERPDRHGLWRSPLVEYLVPVFATGRATPILEAQRRAASGADAAREPETPPPLAHFEGPVSANPIGVYEAWPGRALPDDRVAHWNAFNAGELVWPRTRRSLLLPAAAVAPWLGLAGWCARRADASRA